MLAGASLDDGTLAQVFLLILCYLLARERQRYSLHSEIQLYTVRATSYFHDRPTDRPTDRDRSFPYSISTMSIYEEVEIEDLDYDPATQTYTYPCPCGDKFSITLEELWDGEDIATVSKRN